MSTARVLIAEAHPFYRHSLAKLLTASGIEVVAEAANGWAAVKAAERTNPDVVVYDLELPGLAPTVAIARFVHRTPPAAVLVLSDSADEADVSGAIRAGAGAYLLKDGPATEIVAGVRALVAGHALVSPRVGAVVLRKIRERAQAR